MPENIGKYKILEEIGAGGMGVVYKAFDPQVEREVAIKLVLDAFIKSPEQKERFCREARMAGKLSHPNIAIVHDLAEHEGSPYIVMEYLDGPTLGECIKSKKHISLIEKLTYTKQVCQGLKEAHDNGVIHRDIKPENIHVLKNGQVKIIDFGIAKPMATEGATASEKSLTREGTRIGTPWYMSPEQIRGLDIDSRSDIFSLGIVLYELLTYKKPFEGEETTVIYRICNEDPEPIKMDESLLSEEIQGVVSKCLKKNPEDRYDDCAQLMGDLDEIIDRANAARRLREVLAEGYELLDKGLTEEALVRFQEVLNMDPQNKQVEEKVKELLRERRDSETVRILTGKVAGDQVGRYRIGERLGAGGMGVVYKAEDPDLKRTVAIKFLSPDLTRDEAAKKRFLREARAASAFVHPNICTIYEIGRTDDGMMYIAMEYCPGDSLRQQMDDRKLVEPDDITDVIIQVASGLGKAHENGIVHRDIKPHNVVIGSNHEAKIVDFGICKLSGGTRITRTGRAFGTLPYMSPEHVRGDEVDHRTDIWSLGVMLYELLTGSLPFAGGYEAALLYAIANEAPNPASSVNPDVPPELERIIDRALHKDVELRYQSTSELIDDLELYRLRQQKGEKDNRLTTDRAGEVQGLIDNGMIYVERRECAEALTRFEAALRIDPDNEVANEYRRKCMEMVERRERMDELYAQANAYYEGGSYAHALEVLNEIVLADPEYERAIILVRHTRKALARLEQIEEKLAEGEFHFKRNNYRKSIEACRVVLELDPEEKKAARLLAMSEDVLRQAEEEGKTKPAYYTPSPIQKRRTRTRTWTGFKPPIGRAVWIGGAVVVILGGSFGASRIIWRDDGGRAATTETGSPDGASPRGAGDKVLTPVPAGKSDVDEAKQKAAIATPKPTDADTTRQEVVQKPTVTADPNVEIQKLRSVATNVQLEMMGQKQTADAENAEKLSPDLYAQGRSKEQAAERGLQTTDTSGLRTAAKDFTAAGDLYRRAADDAKLKRQETIAKRRETQRKAALKGDAEGKRADAIAARDAVPGTDGDKAKNATYQEALAKQNDAEARFKAGEYKQASALFLAAQDLHQEAASELSELMSQVSAEEDARRQISQLINVYERRIENRPFEALNELLTFNTDERRSWSEFFGKVEDVAIGIGRGDIEINGDRANVQLQLVISHKINKRRQRANNIERTVRFARVDGQWKVVPSE